MTRPFGRLFCVVALLGAGEAWAQQPGVVVTAPQRGVVVGNATAPAVRPQAAPAVRTQVTGTPVTSTLPVAGTPVVGGYIGEQVTYYGAPWSAGEITTYPIAPVYGSTDLPGGFTYSYYGSWTNQPRVYQSYGPSDPFPFYGQPYGHAYDRYTWGAMSGENRLARYFYPPVP